MPALDRPVDVDAFWKDGYTIVRDVYSKDEINAFRDACRNGGGAPGGDLLARPGLRSALTDGVMIGIAKKILRSDQIWYGGDSAYTINSNSHGWHKDNADRRDGKAPDWRSDYTQLRFGIYLQDHTRHTSGLNLRKGSHNVKPPSSEGENIYVKTRIGDVGVWSMRITHSGNGTLLRFPPGKTVDPNEKKPIPSWRIAPKDGDRMAIFVALGLDDDHAARYTEYLKTRTYMVNAWRTGQYDEEALAEAKRAGLIVRNVPSEVVDDPHAGQQEGWAPLPY